MSELVISDHVQLSQFLPTGAKEIYERFGWEGRNLMAISRDFHSKLDALEKVPVKFVDEAYASQRENFEKFLNKAKQLKKSLKQYSSKPHKAALLRLKRRVIGLKYRIEQVNGGLASHSEGLEDSCKTLEDLAVKWKNSIDLYKEKTLSDREKEKLKEVARYPKFAKLLDADAHLRVSFFKWALRDNCGVDEFVQFPSTIERLKKAHLSGRIGLFVKNFSLFRHGKEKTLVLPFEVREGGSLKRRFINILNEETSVILRGGLQTTVKKTLDAFARKNETPGGVEFFGEKGITNWDSHNLRWWNEDEERWEWIDVTKENWWEDRNLPVFQTYSEEEMCKVYGLNDVEPGQWVPVAKASRESATTDINKSHGYMDVLIPDGKGRYRLFSVGKFAKQFPISFLQRALIIGNTVEARIQYPDENSYYSHRQHALTPFVIKPEFGRELMVDIGKDIVEARAGNIVFQLAWENCAWWPQRKLEKLLGPAKYGGPVPEFYRASFFDSQPKIEPFKSAANFAKNLSKRVQAFVLSIMEFVFQSWRGVFVIEKGRRVFKSLDNSPFHKEEVSFIPAFLHKRIEQGEIPGKLIFGI